jgi:hypothetical protein
MLRFNAFTITVQSSVPDMIQKAVAPLRQTVVMKANPVLMMPATLLPSPPVETINILLNPAPGAAASRSKPI